jgi:hypothetical protein
VSRLFSPSSEFNIQNQFWHHQHYFDQLHTHRITNGKFPAAVPSHQGVIPFVKLVVIIGDA